MASQLKVDTLTGVTTAGSIDVTGEGNSTTTNLQQGLAKQWVSLDQTGTAAINDSFNTASVTDNGTGDFNSTFANNMNSANGYAVSLCCGDSGARFHGDIVNKAAVTSSTYRTYWVNTTDAAENDNDIATSIVHGDLA
jgi:hypothetical protein